MGGLLAKMIDKLKENTEEERTVTDNAAVLFEREYAEFRQDILSLSKSEIYDSAGMIRFYLNMRDYAVYSDELDYETALKINTDNPIAALWDRYLDTELSADSYEDIGYLFDETFPVANCTVLSMKGENG